LRFLPKIEESPTMPHRFLPALAFLLIAPLLLAADKPPPIKEISIKERPDVPKASADKPVVITTEDQLKDTFKDEDVRDQIKKNVDFKNEQLLVFAWKGSGGDKIKFTVDETRAGFNVNFTFKQGQTDDLRSHLQMFVLPKDATWKVK
jgi:hypothetical protein